MKTNFKLYGEYNSENLIILHGLFGMLDNWTTLAKQFASDYKVFTIDLRNHGKSEHVDDMNYTLMAEDLKDFMDEQDIYTANIIGHSMGGKAVMSFTNLYPERVERMIVVDIAPKAYAPKHSEIIESLEQLPISKMETREEADKWLNNRIQNFSIRQFLLKNMSRTAEGFKWKMNLPAIVKHYSEIIGEVEIDNGFERPVLFIYGGKSNYIDDDDFETLEMAYDNVKFVKVENAGHWVHAEQPKQFYEEVSSFIKEPLF